MVAKRQIEIQPYKPSLTENLGDNTGQYADSDVGKGMKYSGDAMVLCASGDAIAGFITSVEPGTKDGYSIGGVRKDGRIGALDEAGTLAVGNIVVAGTAGTLGTLAAQKVIVEPTAGDAHPFNWIVISVTGSGANRACLVERV